MATDTINIAYRVEQDAHGARHLVELAVGSYPHCCEAIGLDVLAFWPGRAREWKVVTANVNPVPENTVTIGATT